MPKDPVVTAETDLTGKTRKKRTVKPKPSDYEQAVAICSKLDLREKSDLVMELKKQLTEEGRIRQDAAEEAAKILEAI